MPGLWGFLNTFHPCLALQHLYRMMALEFLNAPVLQQLGMEQQKELSHLALKYSLKLALSADFGDILEILPQAAPFWGGNEGGSREGDPGPAGRNPREQELGSARMVGTVGFAARDVLGFNPKQGWERAGRGQVPGQHSLSRSWDIVTCAGRQVTQGVSMDP